MDRDRIPLKMNYLEESESRRCFQKSLPTKIK